MTIRNGRPKVAPTKGGREPVEASSGNVFADLGFRNPELVLAKADLVIHIGNAIAARRLTQVQAAAVLGLDQPKLSALLRGNTTGFSLDRLFRLLNKLGQHVEIAVRPSARPQAGVRVVD